MGIQPKHVEAETLAAPDLLIGLGHKKRVGKDTFSDFLTLELMDRGYEVFRFAFAGAMKGHAALLFGDYGLQPPLYYERHPEKRECLLPVINKSPRQLWIEFGNAMRGIDPEIWIREVFSLMGGALKCGASKKKPVACIITDVRFPDEAASIKNVGGKLLKITCDSAPRGTDPAEVALDDYRDWDYVVPNNGDLNNLVAVASCAANFLHTKPNWKEN